ncbi:hypothetical protein [Psychrilyobacter sp.]|uniref:hypothetical protein n=1 Tax=Psychrilyobacter sp. TaxID=2586924 RepID=UPI00301B0E2A
MKKLILFLSLMVSVAITSFSETTNFQLGLTPTLNIGGEEEVVGLRVPVFLGATEKVTGVDFNIFAGEVDEFTGLQGGIFLGMGIFNKVNIKFKGAGLGLINLHGGESKGLLIGGANLTNEFTGLKVGIFNYSKLNSNYEVGIINYSKEAFFQFGLINITDQINGVQIGFLNFASNGILPVMPFLNFNWKL